MNKMEQIEYFFYVKPNKHCSKSEFYDFIKQALFYKQVHYFLTLHVFCFNI